MVSPVGAAAATKSSAGRAKTTPKERARTAPPPMTVVPCFSDADDDSWDDRRAGQNGRGLEGDGFDGTEALGPSLHSTTSAASSGGLEVVSEKWEEGGSSPASSSNNAKKAQQRRGRRRRTYRWSSVLPTRRGNTHRNDNRRRQRQPPPPPQDRRSGLADFGKSSQSDRTGLHLRRFSRSVSKSHAGDDDGDLRHDDASSSSESGSEGGASAASEGMLNRYQDRLKKKQTFRRWFFGRRRSGRRERGGGGGDGDPSVAFDDDENDDDDDIISIVDSEWDPDRNVPEFVTFELGEEDSVAFGGGDGDDDSHRHDNFEYQDHDDDPYRHHEEEGTNYTDDQARSVSTHDDYCSSAGQSLLACDSYLSNTNEVATAANLHLHFSRHSRTPSVARRPSSAGSLASARLKSLSAEQRKCLRVLQYRHAPRFAGLRRSRRLHRGYTDEVLLRFAHFHSFRVERASSHLNNFNADRWLYLSVMQKEMEAQLWARVLFPLPAGLRTKEGGKVIGSNGLRNGKVTGGDGNASRGGMPVFYMKPSRHIPKGPHRTRTRTVIDNLAYVMKVVAQEEEEREEEREALLADAIASASAAFSSTADRRSSSSSSSDSFSTGAAGQRRRPRDSAPPTAKSTCCTEVAFLANMDHWTMKNFSLTYCFQFMQTLQGRNVPVKCALFLIVNPPGWFDTFYKKLMRPMLTADFRRRIRMIREEELGRYLREGYEDYLPDDMKSGRGDTAEMVRGFVRRRKAVEQPLRQRQQQQQQGVMPRRPVGRGCSSEGGRQRRRQYHPEIEDRRLVEYDEEEDGGGAGDHGYGLLGGGAHNDVVGCQRREQHAEMDDHLLARYYEEEEEDR